jgi:hypothetical protein
MSIQPTTRIAVNDEYVFLIGKAIYIFSYYEWVMIYIMENLQPGFASRYSRGKPMTSGEVKNKLQAVISSSSSINVKQIICDCANEFEKLVIKRNSLIHAHPITDADESQILAYQTEPTKPLPDMKWTKEEVVVLISEFDAAACRAMVALESFR